MLTPFTGIRTFLKAPQHRQTQVTRLAKYTIVGAPTDMAVTFRTGARMGPAAIREASLMLADGEHPKYRVDPIRLGAVWDAGDIDPEVNNPSMTANILKGNLDKYDHPVVLGGDHSITLQALRSRRARHDRPLALLHFDAHADTWEGDNHGTFLRQAIDEDLVNPHKVVQIGIRSPIPNDVMDWTLTKGVRVISAEDVHFNFSMHELDIQIKNRIGYDDPCYLTFDIDCLDPAFAPGTGTPEIGGLTSAQALRIMHGVRNFNFVGMDLVEVLPAHDNNQITAVAAATIVWNYLCMQLAKDIDILDQVQL